MHAYMYFRWQAATVVCVVIIAIQQQSVAVCLVGGDAHTAQALPRAPLAGSFRYSAKRSRSGRNDTLIFLWLLPALIFASPTIFQLEKCGWSARAFSRMNSPASPPSLCCSISARVTTRAACTFSPRTAPSPPGVCPRARPPPRRRRPRQSLRHHPR